MSGYGEQNFLQQEKEVKYKSLYNDKLLTLAQWLLEIMYKNNKGVDDLSAYLRDGQNKSNYRKNIVILHRLLKKYRPEDIYSILLSKKPSDAPLLYWWVKKECLTITDHFSAQKDDFFVDKNEVGEPVTSVSDLRESYVRKPNKNILQIIEDINGKKER